MMHLGQLSASFSQSIDVCLDPQSKQNLVMFSLSACIPVVELLQQLERFQPRSVESMLPGMSTVGGCPTQVMGPCSSGEFRLALPAVTGVHALSAKSSVQQPPYSSNQGIRDTVATPTVKRSAQGKPHSSINMHVLPENVSACLDCISPAMNPPGTGPGQEICQLVDAIKGLGYQQAYLGDTVQHWGQQPQQQQQQPQQQLDVQLQQQSLPQQQQQLDAQQWRQQQLDVPHVQQLPVQQVQKQAQQQPKVQQPQLQSPPPIMQVPGSEPLCNVGKGTGISSAASPLNVQLIDALRDNNVSMVKLTITQRADVNCTNAGPLLKSPMYHALDAGGNVEVVNLLIMARASIHAVDSHGKTLLHHAIQKCTKIPPVVIRMLLSLKADLNKSDDRGITPLWLTRMAAMQLHTQCQDRVTDGTAHATDTLHIRQLLHEVTDEPTMAVVVMDAQEVKRVFFADTENNRLVFHTESSVGLYSLKSKKMIFIKRLRQLQEASVIQHMSVNPQLGTIAVCLSIMDRQVKEGDAMQNLIFVWPKGHLEDEEPLKLTMHISLSKGDRQLDMLPACVKLSWSQGPQVMLGRLSDGQVICWHLNAPRSQLTAEEKLLSRGGEMAISEDGCWMAMMNKEHEAEERLEVWAKVRRSTRSPKHIMSMQKRATGLAITQTPSDAGQDACLLIVAEAAIKGMPQPPIEVFSVKLDGSSTTAYRVQCHSRCHLLSFAGRGSTLHFLSGHMDGLAIVCNLAMGTKGISHNSPGLWHIDLSPDHELIATSESNFVRVYRAPGLQA